LIKRELYLNKIRPFIDKPLIKVLTGMRRSGKSSILELLKEELVERGINSDSLIFINFENLDFIDIDSAKKLDLYVKGRLDPRKRCYLLLDEIQEVNGWERAINSLMTSTNTDIYITGSNSHLLSSELSTYLTGRYVEININTLSFSEYLKFRKVQKGQISIELNSELKRYIRSGGFPVIHLTDYSYDTSYKIVRDIYDSAILRDTIERHGIRNIEMLKRVVKFVFDNIGNTFSAKKVADYFKSQQRRVDLNTIYNYLNALESAFIIRKISRYDVKGKAILQTNEKYFIGDHSLLYAVMGFKDRSLSGVLENIVFMELLGRGYEVYVGKLGDKEIDFIACRGEYKFYIQVSYRISDSEEEIEREYRPLLKVRDHYPKYVVTMDDFFQDSIEGIRHIPLADFLLMDSF
jgi:uncharacterized protein